MPAPTTVSDLIELVQKSGVVEATRLAAYVQQLRDQGALPADPVRLADLFVRDGVLTGFQKEQILLGKWRRFNIGKYKVLEKLGSGGMGQVYLCEHRLMRRKVAVKVLPTAKAEDPSSLERFHREARAVAALDHPNLVRAFDIDQDAELHFIVMEYVDGASLQEMVKRAGPLDPTRACHYVYHAAVGLQYAYEVAELVHRDIKPGNIMVDRQGAVKILDMGLARFFNDEEDILTKKYDESVLGTADYLSPEQAVDSHGVGIRADIYSLGATFYYLLAGKPPFPDGTVAQKLISHQTKAPKPVRLFRPEVPESMAAVLERMMAKDPAARYQTPAELAGTLAPFVRSPIPPPPETELPQLSLAAGGPAAAAPGPGRWADAPAPPTAARPANSAASSAVAAAARPSLPTQATAASDPLRGYPALPTTQRSVQTPRQQSTAPPPPRADVNPFANLFVGAGRPAGMAPNVYAATSPPPPAAQPARAGSNRTVWVAAAAAGLLALAAGAYAVVRWGNPASPTSAVPAADAARPAHRLTVARDAQRGVFRTIAEAVAQARPGDEVAILDPVHEEPKPLVLDGRHAPGVTIASGLNDGRPVTWQLAADRDTSSIVEVNNCDDVRLNRLILDGRGHVDTPLRLVGLCPGTTVEDVRLQRFKQSGVKLANCGGDPGRPVTLRRVRATADGIEADAGLVLFANPAVLRPKTTEHVVVRDCMFDGPFKAAIVIDGGTDDVTVEGNRFYRATDGVRGKELRKDQPLRLTLAGNTFSELKDAVAVAGAADDGRSRIAIRQNLFVNCETILKVEKGQARKLVAAEANGRDHATKDGQLPTATHEYAAEFVSTDSSHDGFLRCRKDGPLAHAGLNGTPIGVPEE